MISCRGEIKAVSSGLCFGIAPIFMKFGFWGGRDAFYGIAIAAGTGLLLNLVVMTGKDFWKDLFLIRGRIFLLIILGGIANTVAMFALYWAVALGEISIVVPVSCTYPLFTIIFSRFWSKEAEEISKRMVGGTLLIIIGVILIL
jgi:uncharacterized membrane protein